MVDEAVGGTAVPVDTVSVCVCVCALVNLLGRMRFMLFG
jgi:hypothetical protein